MIDRRDNIGLKLDGDGFALVPWDLGMVSYHL